MTRLRSRSLRGAPVALLAAVVLLAGCSGGATAAPTSSTTTTEADPTTDSPRAPSTTAPTTTVDPSAPSVQRHGQLSVCGTDLCDRSGQAIQLRGMSTHGLQWYRQCLTDASLDVLFDEWHADLLRTSMYVHEGGYLTDPVAYTTAVQDLVDELIERDRYAIIDWHVLTPGDPMGDVGAAVEFFSGMAERYADHPNVIYEIANEPNGVPWSRIKEYAEQVIPAIRAHDDDAVILVGTPAWSSFGVSESGSPAEVVADPLADDDVMYTFHFYAADFREPYLDALAQASDSLPVFVSEFGAQESTGGGPNDFEMAQRFVDLMAAEQIRPGSCGTSPTTPCRGPPGCPARATPTVRGRPSGSSPPASGPRPAARRPLTRGSRSFCRCVAVPGAFSCRPGRISAPRTGSGAGAVRFWVRSCRPGPASLHPERGRDGAGAGRVTRRGVWRPAVSTVTVDAATNRSHGVRRNRASTKCRPRRAVR